MNFFKLQVFPLNVITTLFIFIAVAESNYSNGLRGAVITFGIFVVWAIVSSLTEKFYLNKRPAVGFYMLHAVGMSALLATVTYILDLVFGR